jgi:alpha-beta hydrolase superfamily lysophospholipase
MAGADLANADVWNASFDQALEPWRIGTGCPDRTLRGARPALTMAAAMEFALTTADGPRLHGQGWMPEQARGVMVIVHGIAEHGGRYAWLAERANARGIGVLTVDLRGHGRSPGERSYVERFDDYLLDVDALWAKAQELAAGRPLFLMGHSMGGAIALRWAAQRRAGHGRADPVLGGAEDRRRRAAPAGCAGAAAFALAAAYARHEARPGTDQPRSGAGGGLRQ